MKHLMLGTAMALVGTLPAFAQDIFRPMSDASVIYASDFLGMRVYAAETPADADAYEGVQEGWNDIGEINDLILARDGSVEAVLVDIGGFLGMGERQVAVEMDAIRFVADSATADNDGDFFLVLNANRALIEGAPQYDRSAMADPAAPGATDATATTPDATGTATTTDTTATTGTATDGTTTATDGTAVATDGTATTGTATDGTATATDGTGMAADGTATTTAREGYVAADWAQITTEELTGVNVYGSDEETVGEISNFVLAEDNKISHVVVDVGGFLGIGTKPVAIDAKDLQVMRADADGSLRAYVSMTRDQIEQLPDAEL